MFSGADGSLLFTLDTPKPQYGAGLGHSVAVGDVNGDGKGDVAVGAHEEDVGGTETQGRAYVFSSADGSLLSTLNTPNPESHARFGSSVATGDVNGDGRADVAVGSPYEDVDTNLSAGRAYVFSLTPPPTLTPTPTPPPTPTPTPGPPAIGGIVELRTGTDARSEQSAFGSPLPLAASVTIGMLLLGAGGLYVVKMRRG